MKYFFLVLLLGTGALFNTTAQVKSQPPVEKVKATLGIHDAATLSAFQERLIAAVKKVQPASVRVITNEKLTPTGGVSASGVCVSASGIIMTAGHLTVPGGDYMILFPDGSEVKAKGLGKIGLLDLGLLKISDDGLFPYAEMGWSSALQIGEPCFSLAYPGSFTEKQVLRFGEVLGKDVGQFHSLQTTCLMEPGDSGGPVFDMNGKVIGIRSYIGMPLDENFEVAVDNYRKYWDELQKPVNYSGIPQVFSDKTGGEKYRYKGLMWQEIETDILAVTKELSGFSLEVKSGENTSTRSVLGTVVDLSGITTNKKFLKGSFIVSKNSEVGNDPRIEINGKLLAAKIIYRDSENDLVLLKLDAASKSALRVYDDVSDPSEVGTIGELLVSPFPGGEYLMSVIGTTPFKMPGVYETGYLGVKVETEDGLTTVTHVQPHSAADEAMLREGDVVVSVNEQKVSSPDDLITILKKSRVRDIISLTVLRDGKMDSFKITLQGRPFVGSGHIAEKFAGGRSDRRDGFDHVFIHDARLKPSDCGGPIFNLEGKFLGINMARYSRTSSIGMTAGEVVKFLKEVIISGK